MKFLIDVPLSPSLASRLKAQGHDAVHATDLALHAASDREIIERAIADTPTIVTADLDYPRLIAIAGSNEPSLILFRSGNWTEAGVRTPICRCAQRVKRRGHSGQHRRRRWRSGPQATIAHRLKSIDS